MGRAPPPRVRTALRAWWRPSTGTPAETAPSPGRPRPPAGRRQEPGPAPPTRKASSSARPVARRARRNEPRARRLTRGRCLRAGWVRARPPRFGRSAPWAPGWRSGRRPLAHSEGHVRVGRTPGVGRDLRDDLTDPRRVLPWRASQPRAVWPNAWHGQQAWRSADAACAVPRFGPPAMAEEAPPGYAARPARTASGLRRGNHVTVRRAIRRRRRAGPDGGPRLGTRILGWIGPALGGYAAAAETSTGVHPPGIANHGLLRPRVGFGRIFRNAGPPRTPPRPWPAWPALVEALQASGSRPPATAPSDVRLAGGRAERPSQARTVAQSSAQLFQRPRLPAEQQ